MTTWVLAGDVGGTKTNLAIYRFEEPRKASLAREETFPSRAYDGLEQIAGEFLERGAVGRVDQCYRLFVCLFLLGHAGALARSRVADILSDLRQMT